ncbi:MAG: class I SAM-dependent methyltransferase, partial [Planctomycetes bacterium]|nr:class I SAM-dependent methyltransferase [Planctomycetota bacterium]
MLFNKESAGLVGRVLVGFYLLIAAVPAFSDSLELLKSSGVEAGLVVHLNCGDGTETVRLSANERLLVQGLDDDDAQIQKARHNIRAAGCYGRVSVMKYDGGRLPYVDNLVNVIIADGDFAVSKKEILRVLAPLGVAFVNGRKIVKPWPDNMDEWNHFLHGSDNNAVAKDSVIGIPRSIQWVSPPRWGRSHEELAGMSAAVSAKGRVFFIFDRAPLASIRYSGQWE